MFVGRFDGYRGPSDLYVHLSAERIQRSVIARWGNSGPDYSSGTAFAFGLIPDLTEARIRAEKRGLLDYDVYEALEYAVSGSDSHAEMRRHLPFTLEYQAYLAHEKGHGCRSEALVRHLFALAGKNRQHANVGEVLTVVEGRLRRVVSALRAVSAINDPVNRHLAEMTAFLWEEHTSTLESGWNGWNGWNGFLAAA
ncbi:hypothetical protein AS149_14555 [Burkholderia cenocepacia]|nr:hypothetical protein AS149_14555 [Burkholderia cenocepacia]